MIKEENIEFLKQLVSTLEKVAPKLEEAYKIQSVENFNKIKKFILELQKRIYGAIE